MEAVDALRSQVETEASRLSHVARGVRQIVASFDASSWTGAAAEAFAQRLREVLAAAEAASVRHAEAERAFRVWSQGLSEVQETADAALLAAEEAQADLALAQAAVGSLGAEYAALTATVSAMEKVVSATPENLRPGAKAPTDSELASMRSRAAGTEAELAAARGRVADAQERLDDACARVVAAGEEFDLGERLFVNDLESAMQGAVQAFASLTPLGAAGPQTRGVPGPNEGNLGAIRNLIDRANDSVWKLTAAWVSGKGPRHFTFGETDPFTIVFRRSDSVKEAMAAMAKRIREEGYGVGDTDALGYSAKASDLPRDANTIASFGKEGNLPEAFMGSFTYTFTILSIDDHGHARVAVRVTNPTTVESATRIPGSESWPLGPHYLGPYAPMKASQAFGGFPDITQEVTWTEVVPLR
ncbi:hypothetical protein HNO83_19610 [Leifsonia sp. C5G2]|nr:hypothetical protein [Leifsonia sp. C5G2]